MKRTTIFILLLDIQTLPQICYVSFTDFSIKLGFSLAKQSIFRIVFKGKTLVSLGNNYTPIISFMFYVFNVYMFKVKFYVFML